MGGGGGVYTHEGEMLEWREVGETLKRKEASHLPFSLPSDRIASLWEGASRF